jgi:ubiquinone biosynthesis protein COQ9
MTDIRTIRADIIAAALPHIPFDGWTLAAMRRGAVDAGYDEATATRAFPYGSGDMVQAYSRALDRHMLERLKRMKLDPMKVRERIAAAVRVRLEEMAPHREAVRRAVAVSALPLNAPTAAKCLYDAVDAMWRAAGDTATDWNYYTKRALLAGVYSSTVLYWLDDRSEDSAESWAFLERRIDDVMRIPRISKRVRQFGERLRKPVRFGSAERTY